MNIYHNRSHAAEESIDMKMSTVKSFSHLPVLPFLIFFINFFYLLTYQSPFPPFLLSFPPFAIYPRIHTFTISIQIRNREASQESQ